MYVWVLLFEQREIGLRHSELTRRRVPFYLSNGAQHLDLVKLYKKNAGRES